MSRRITVFILFILLVNLTGFYGYFIFRLNQIHEESRQALKFLPDSELDHFILTSEEYRKAKVNDHEILIADKMYDVARVKFRHEVVEIFALHDEAEDDLLAFIKEVMNNAEKDGQAPSVFSQFAFLQFMQPVFDWSFDFSGTAIVHHTGLVIVPFSADEIIHSPPPRSL